MSVALLPVFECRDIFTLCGHNFWQIAWRGQCSVFLWHPRTGGLAGIFQPLPSVCLFLLSSVVFFIAKECWPRRWGACRVLRSIAHVQQCCLWAQHGGVACAPLRGLIWMNICCAGCTQLTLITGGGDAASGKYLNRVHDCGQKMQSVHRRPERERNTRLIPTA